MFVFILLVETKMKNAHEHDAGFTLNLSDGSESHKCELGFIPDISPCSKPSVPVFKQLQGKRVHPLHRDKRQLSKICQSKLARMKLAFKLV